MFGRWIGVMVLLLLACQSACVLEPTAPANEEYSLGAALHECVVPFRRVSRGSDDHDLAECQVLDSGKIGVWQSHDYYFAIYCLVPNYQEGAQACAMEATRSHVIPHNGMAVFEAPEGSQKVRLFAVDVGAGEDVIDVERHWMEGHPYFVDNFHGRWLVLPMRMEGSGADVSQYFLWNSGRWRSIDGASSWAKELQPGAVPGG